jgi:hypothetical protein
LICLDLRPGYPDIRVKTETIQSTNSYKLRGAASADAAAAPLADNDALAAFEAFRRTPEFFRRYLSRYLAYADLGAKAALIDTEAHVLEPMRPGSAS